MLLPSILLNTIGNLRDAAQRRDHHISPIRFPQTDEANPAAVQTESGLVKSITRALQEPPRSQQITADSVVISPSWSALLPRSGHGTRIAEEYALAPVIDHGRSCLVGGYAVSGSMPR
jgi:hypothetical protein